MSKKKKTSLKSLQLMEPLAEVSLSTPIVVLYNLQQFSTRTYRAVCAMNCQTAKDLLLLNPASLHEVKNVGATCVAELMAFQLRYKNLQPNEAIEEQYKVSPFDAAKETLSNTLSEHYAILKQYAFTLQHPVRLTLDLIPYETPRFAINEISGVPPTEKLKMQVKEEKNDTEEAVSSEEKSELDDFPIPPKKKKVLEIITPTGESWTEKFAYLTLMRFIEEVGIERIAALGIEPKPGYQLISKEILDKAGSKASQNGYFIFTGFSNSTKARIVKEISDRFGLGYSARNYSIEID